MIDPLDLYNDFNGFVNTFQGGFYPPQSVFIRAVNNISLELWEMWTREAEKSQEVKDNLFPFLVSKNVISNQQNSYYGIVTPPTNYGRFASAKILLTNENMSVPDKTINKGMCINGKSEKGKDKYVSFKADQELAKDYYDNTREQEIEMIENQRWSAVLKHLTKKPTFESPKMTQIDGGFKVAPREVSVVVLDYYTKPKEATFIYTQAPGNIQTGAGGQVIYNANLSVPLQWPGTVKNEFLCRLGVKFGLYTRDQFVTQVSMVNKKDL